MYFFKNHYFVRNNGDHFIKIKNLKIKLKLKSKLKIKYF